MVVILLINVISSESVLGKLPPIRLFVLCMFVCLFVCEFLSQSLIKHTIIDTTFIIKHPFIIYKRNR